MRPRVIVLWVTILAAPVRADEPTEMLQAPGFGNVALYAPRGAPSQVALFVSGDGGWNLGVVSMAERLRELGALVVGIDIRSFLKSLESSKGCAYPAGPLEELSRAVQLHRGLPAYQAPMLVGYSSGATLVYATLVAAPPEAFAGAISLGFCSDLQIHKALCTSRGLSATRKARGVGYRLAPFAGLSRPWVVLHGEADQVCAPDQTRAFAAATGRTTLHSLPKVGHGFAARRNWDRQFVDAYREIAAAAPAGPGLAVPSRALADLDLVEVPAERGERDVFALILTGDGGWAEIDGRIAEELAAHGIPSVGWSSLRYYWTPRKPEAAASDMGRILEHYLTAWSKRRALVIGYSFGADVLPFLVNRLPAAAAERVAAVALLGLSTTATFEFHVSSWLGFAGAHRLETLPEVRRLRAPVTCIHGSDESDSACPALRGSKAQIVAIGRGHHFGGNYAQVVDAVLRSVAAQ